MNIHILAIAGAMTTPLSLALQQSGHRITGSDQDKIYPPFSLQLAKANIPLNQPLPADIDLAIIGSGYQKFATTRDQFDQIVQHKIPHISATEYLAQNVIRPKSILVAGSHGKTTITSLLAYIFTTAGLNPAFMFGGQTESLPQSLKFSDSPWSIVEADESINGLDTQAKFLYYPVKYLILTSANWEHKESYASADDNTAAFRQLVQNLPSDGLFVYNPQDPLVSQLVKFSKAQNIPYSVSQQYPTLLIGQHNQQNIAAAVQLCLSLGIDHQIIKSSVASFAGVKKRLEVVADKANIIFIDDFAQSTQRIIQSLSAISAHYPSRPIKVFFAPHASFIKNNQSLQSLSQAFVAVSEIIVSRPHLSPTSEKITGQDIARAISPKAKYFPLYEDIGQHFISTLAPHDILVHMSSGGLDNYNCFIDIINSFS